VLLCLAGIGPIFQVVNYLTRGFSILSGPYPRIALLLVVVAGSGMAATLLMRQTAVGGRALVHGKTARQVGLALLILNLAFVVVLGVAWAVAARQDGPLESSTLPEGLFGVALAPFGEGQEADVSDRSSEALEQLLRELDKELRRTGLSKRVALRTIGPVTSDEGALEWAERTGAELVVWGRIEPGEPEAAGARWTDGTLWEPSSLLDPFEIITASLQGETILIGSLEPVPHSMHATALVGQAALHLRDYDTAVAQFDKALAAAGELSEDAAPPLSGAWRGLRGHAHWLSGNLDLARDDFIASIGLHPDAGTYCALGNLYLARDDVGGAVGNYRQALALDPYRITPYIGMGYAYASQGDLEAAIGQLEQAKRIRPTFSPTYLALGRLYRDRGQVMLAREAFDHCVVLARSNEDLIAAANDELKNLALIPVTPTPSPTPTLSATLTPMPAAAVTPTASAEAPEVSATTESYVVRPNDNLTAIAARFDTTVEAIVEANDLRNADAIYVGQELTIPAE
jgi:tetratricopeptide (TPR) repeat protein